MKQVAKDILFALILAGAIVLLLTSCQKDDDCRYCTETITIFEPDTTATHQRVVWLCDEELLKLGNKTKITYIGSTMIVSNYKCE